MARPVSADAEVAEFAGQLFFWLWRASHTRTVEALASIGLTTAQFAVLNAVGAREGVIQQQLSVDMNTDPSAMVKLINGLEGAHLVERRRRPNDRRAWEVVITTQGRHRLEQGRRLAGEVEDMVLGSLSSDDRRQLLTLLRRALASAPPQPEWRAEEEE